MILDIPFYILITVLGLLFGSYLNSWIWRVHEEKYCFGGRSMCVHCGKALPWYENIPLFSFIFLRGKCSSCKKPIPVDYFLVELVTGFLFFFIAYFSLAHSLSAPAIFRLLFFTGVLIVTFVYDAKYSEVLTDVTWLAALVGFIFNYRYLGFSIQNMLVGFVFGAGFFLVQYLLTRGKGVGGGDVRLGAMIGVWVGWPGVLFALLISYVIGAIFSIPLLITKQKKFSSAIPFGTFLALGTMATLLWGSQILGWYNGLMGRL